jgi:phosphate uptake regulator
MMELAEKALEKLAHHEKLCEERLRRLDEKIDAAHKDIASNRNAVFALYPFIVGAVFLADWFQ